MMNPTTTIEWMYLVPYFAIGTMFLCGALLWYRRHENRKQRILQAAAFVISGVWLLFHLLTTCKEGMPESYPLLPVLPLYGGCWILLLLLLYPAEAIRPGWLGWRNVLLLSLPVILLSVIPAVVPFEFRELHSYSELLESIGEPNVWFRLAALSVFLLPYPVLRFCVPYHWRQSSVDAKWIRAYASAVQGVGVSYLLFMATGTLVCGTIFLTCCTLFSVYATYQELYVRLFPGEVQTPPEKIKNHFAEYQNKTL